MVLPPVTPRPNQLPLNDPNWTWDRFEAFCLDLISKFAEIKDCHRYGKQGDFQRGIDIFADLNNSERWVFQCKRYKKYTEGQAQKAIQTTTYPANRYILLLSCEATSKVRDEVDKHPNWDVWDVQDISLKVRELPPDVARRLVETHFSPEWRRAFLGLAGLTAFVSAADFFRRFLNPNNLFNHLWSLVGRKNFIEGLHEFVQSEQQKVVILTGRGGIGKTKLLHAFAKEFDNRHQKLVLRFLMEGVPISSEILDELPTKSCVVVVDDAHRYDDLSVLLAFAQQHPQKIKLIFSSRPQGVDYLRSLLTQAGFDSREVRTFDSLKELSRDEVKELARQALGNTYALYADRLAAITKDCPLVTVVGGQLLAQNQVDPQLLERDEDFRNSVLTKFQDVLIGQVSARIDPQLCRELLKLIAATAPIQPDTEQFKQLAAEFLDTRQLVLDDAIEILEESGVLLRRGDTVRITPDVLADHILHEACLKLGRTRGYAQQLFEKFFPVYPAQILRNLAELDWRISYISGEETGLLADIWRSIREEFEKASYSGRYTLLDLLEKVAYYQPEPTLELVEVAMRPATTPESESLSSFYTHAEVLRKLPRLLQQISYTMDYLPCCCDLLWELAREDRRELNPYPEHPIRVLTDLAKYDFLHKPLEFNQAVLERVARWLKKNDAHNHQYSPLDVIDPLLSKTAHSNRYDGLTITYYSRPVVREETYVIREQALNLIAECLNSNQLKVILRGLKSLGEALQEPIDSNSQRQEEQCKQWVPEQLKILEFIKDLVDQKKEPIIHLEVIRLLRWHISRGYSDIVRQKALEIIYSIPDTYELRLIGVLVRSGVLDWFINNRGKIDFASFNYNWTEQERRVKKLCLTVIENFLKRHPNAKEGVQVLNADLKAINTSGLEPEPWSFLDTLREVVEPKYAAQMCEAIVEAPDYPLATHLSSLLYRVRKFDVQLAITIAQKAVNTGLPILCGSLAQKCWTWADNLQSEDVELIKKLLAHNDVGVRRLAIHSLGMMRDIQPKLAIMMALAVDIGGSTDLASGLCRVVHAEYGISPDVLTDEELKKLLAKLEPVANIDEYHISEFLAHVSKRLPRTLVQLLLKRIERDEEDKEGSYQPLPYLGFQHKLDGIAKSNEYKNILREIRNQALKRTYHTKFWFPKLFKEASLVPVPRGSDKLHSSIQQTSPTPYCYEDEVLVFSPTSLEVLNEWVASGDRQKIETASCLVSDAPKAFVFTNVEFVANLLEQAYDLGDNCYQTVTYDLFNSATSGVRGGTPGQPFPEDIALQEKSAAVAAQFIVKSPSHRFYDSLAKDAKSCIQFWEKRWEEEFDSL
jgi:hypothetical protein